MGKKEMTFLEALYAKREAEQLIESQIDRIAQMVLWLHGADISDTNIMVYVEPIKDNVTRLTNFHDLKYDYIGGKDDEAFVAVNTVQWLDDGEISDWYNLPKSWLVGRALDDNIDFIRNDLKERKKRMQEHKEYVEAECERIMEKRTRAEVERKQKADAERATLEKEERRKMYEELKKEFEPASKDSQTVRRSYNLYDFDTELDGWLYNHLGILAETLNKEDHLGWNRSMVLEACRDKKCFEALNRTLIEADKQFGADAAYWGVCSYDELKHGLIKKGLVDDESTGV